MSHSSNNNSYYKKAALDDNSNNLKRLSKFRNEDIQESFNEESEESFQHFQRKNSLSDDDFDEKPSFSKADRKRHAHFDDDDEKPTEKKPNYGFGAKLLKQMGYREGVGLGKHGQGIKAPIIADSTHGRLGLGHTSREALKLNFEVVWDESREVKNVEETPLWLKCEDITNAQDNIERRFDNLWIKRGKPVERIEDQDRYCRQELIEKLTQSKDVFDTLKDNQLHEARKRANPYETIGKGIFVNRAAMKTANLDRIFGWRLSQEFNEEARRAKQPLNVDDVRKNATRLHPVFYFADVCAGPGGFSEYMLWRKGYYNAKGFGFTLIGKDDFKLHMFKGSSPCYFDPFYGVHKDGNVMKPDNLTSLEEYVLRKTDNQKVHLFMADGGFSVDGQENLQEVLSKRLYLCQFIAGLSLCRVEDKENHRRGGNFLCKLFDIFTPFSIGLIYLMYLSFDKISLHKPNTSRPANSERYIFCENLNKFGATFVKNYLTYINNELDDLERKQKNKEEDILEIVPREIIDGDERFFKYVVTHNEELIQRQIYYLGKYKTFATNPSAYDKDQADLRLQCLEYWEIPENNKDDDVKDRRYPKHKIKPASDVFAEATKWMFDINEYKNRSKDFHYEFLQRPDEKRLRTKEVLATFVTDCDEPMFVVSTGNHIFFRKCGRTENWQRLGDLSLELPPNTVLLAQISDKLMRDGKSLKRHSKVLRILDAAVLDSDYIADSSYKVRIQAIRKFCVSVNKPTHKEFNPMTKNYAAVKNDEIICADLISFQHLLENMNEMKNRLSKFQGETVALLPCETTTQVNHDSKEEYFFACRGVRFVQTLKAEYIACWSNSSKRMYFFDIMQKRSFFEEAAEKEGIFSSFWSSLGKSDDSEHYVYLWRWREDPHSGYGPEMILKSGGESGPTLEGLERLHKDEQAKIIS